MLKRLFILAFILTLMGTQAQGACERPTLLRNAVPKVFNPSEEVNSAVLKKINHARFVRKLPQLKSMAQASAREYSDNFFQWMRELERKPWPKTVDEEFHHVVQTTDFESLVKIDKLAREIQIERYDRLRREVQSLKKINSDAARTKIEEIETYLQSDPVALGNGPHVKEVIHHIDSHEESVIQSLREARGISQKGPPSSEEKHYFQFLKTLAAVHDLGKTFPNELIAEAAKLVEREGGDVYVTNRISFHEFGSAVKLKELEKIQGFPPDTINVLIRNILGHNDGSGLKDIFWNQIAYPEKILGTYPRPETFATKILALADRGGQGSLGERGGVYKITRQELKRGTFGKLLLDRTLAQNATNTVRQIEAIAQAIGPKAFESPMVKDLIQAQKESLDAYSLVKWQGTGPAGSIEGEPFTDFESFFSILNRWKSKSH